MDGETLKRLLVAAANRPDEGGYRHRRGGPLPKTKRLNVSGKIVKVEEEDFTGLLEVKSTRDS